MRSWSAEKAQNAQANDEIPTLQVGEIFNIPEEILNVRFAAEWTSAPGTICDLDLHVYCYDDKGRFIEKLDFTHSVTLDNSTALVSDEGSSGADNISVEHVTIKLPAVSREVSAFLLFLDGDSRNFQLVNSLVVRCMIPPTGRIADSFVQQTDQDPNLFKASTKTRKDFKGLVLLVIYKDRWEGGQCTYATRCIMEPVYMSLAKEKDDKCSQIVVASVPSLDKFRPRIFSSVRVICGALSSQALPKLKVKFLRGSGLAIDAFIDALYKQLKDTHPKILEANEAAYTVAMLEEMFYQIDFNGDGDCSWEEFTNFAIQSVLSASNSSHDRESGSDTLNEYVIEYGEDVTLRDTVLSPYRTISTFRFFPIGRRFCVVQEDADNIILFNESFEVITRVYPNQIKSVIGSLFVAPTDPVVTSGQHVKKYIIYDVIYLEGVDLLAYCASDHSIGICKEHVTMGGTLSTYTIFNKMYHNHLHVKLCYSSKNSILCSVSSNRVIYGWELTGNTPIFNISRHSDIVTDFIAIDDFGCFATSSMDKKIVVWSATTRRVKALFLGHKRGIRGIHYSKNLLLSVAFETDARIWDLNSKDCTVILRGHRNLLTAGVLMCDRARDFEEFRALTCDESGEMRLWNIFVREKTSEPYLAPALQVFSCQNPEVPVCHIRFLALPAHSKLSTSYYSDIVACSTKLMHFLPEKNAKEFIPPACLLYNDPASTLVTAVGPSVMKYDIGTGVFLHSFLIGKRDVSTLTLDGDRGRKIYVGCSSGEIHTINFSNGEIVASAPGVHTRDITRIICSRSDKQVNIFSCSLDGKIRMSEEIGGELHIKNTLENVFGENAGVVDMAVLPSLRAVLAVSAAKGWGIFNMITLKTVAYFEEDESINAFVIIGASGDSKDLAYQTEKKNARGKPVLSRESLLTLAIATLEHIKIYTIDTIDVLGNLSCILKFPAAAYITSMIIFNAPPQDSVNFSLSRDTGKAAHVQILIAASTDDGYILTWDATDLRKTSETAFRKRYQIAKPKTSPSHIPSPTSTYPSTPAGVGVAPLAGTFLEGNSEEFAIESDDLAFLTESLDRSKINEGFEMNAGYILTNSFQSANTLNRECFLFWRAHSDSIAKIICLGDNGCIQSSSLDGYQRCWNIDGDCLGELLLPNVTEKMLSHELRAGIPKTIWKFLLEKLAVQPRHIEMATKLIDEIKALSRRYTSKSSTRNSIIKARGETFAYFDEDEEDKTVEELTGNDLTRSLVFKDLRSPPVLRDDAPPSRLKTKEEIRLIKQKELLDKQRKLQQAQAAAMATLVQEDEGKSGNTLTSSAPLLLPPVGSVSPKKATSTSSHSKLKKASVISSHQMWAQPKEIFSSHYAIPQAFSADSMLAGFRKGIFDKESLTLLRRVSSQPDKVAAYEHMHDTMLLRSATLSTSIEIPKESTLRQAEVLFGTQKDMYKNADLVLRSREKPSQAAISRNVIALARIDQNLNRVGTMVHVLKHGAQGLKEITVPSNDAKAVASEEDFIANKTEEQQMQWRLMQSAILAQSTGTLPRPLDTDLLAARTAKVEQAMEVGPEFEARMRDAKYKSKSKHKMTISPETKLALERKLQKAIKDIHRPATAGSSNQNKKIQLTNRMLLPYYKVEEIRHYMDVFTAVDSDFSGDLDVNEWVKLFTSMNNSITSHEARMIFMQLNKSGDGVLTSKDLIPIIFNKASKEQLGLIITYVQSEIIQKRNDENCLTTAEVAQLFECYDMDAIGFVAVSVIRDRIRAMQLPENAHFGFMDLIVKLEEDEMLNEQEFTRMLRPYSVRS